MFFSNFSHWENEQLTRVRDYLVRVVSPGMYQRPQQSKEKFLGLVLLIDVAKWASETESCIAGLH